MSLAETPGLSGEEHRAVARYEEAEYLYAPALMGSLLGGAFGGDEEAARGRAREAARAVLDARSDLTAVAPPRVPGRDPEAPSYADLLEDLRERGLGERDGVLPDEPAVAWEELPEARLLAFCCADLMHYRFLCRGTRPSANHLRGYPGDGDLPILFDVPEPERDRLGEEGVTGAHADRLELETRLHRLLERAADDSPEARQEKLLGIGYDCGNEALVFIERYGGDPAYAEGFVEGCLERIRELEDAELTHPEDVTADQFEGLWRDPNLSEEDRRDMVLEPLAADCEAREDEGDLWRL